MLTYTHVHVSRAAHAELKKRAKQKKSPMKDIVDLLLFGKVQKVPKVSEPAAPASKGAPEAKIK